ncbi:MAG TPA: hypothetical protein DCR93_22245 [Cytophagales bacterium]|nr:hypothetical protein [Cytophagales bacterium]HAP62100.1 hypothetical protein [Cytophagales bacterium]
MRPLAGNPYQNPWLLHARQQWPDRAFFDLDADSDEVSVHYAKTFVGEATDLLVSVAISEETVEPGLLLSVLRPLVRQRPATLRIISEPTSEVIKRLYQSLRPDEIRIASIETW